MFDQVNLGREFFEVLERLDESIARRVAEARCAVCKGPLHCGNFARKPRGGLMARAGEAFVLRFSLCCGREGCRKRATPPSLRFLGRRVYLGAVVVLASLVAQALGVASAIRQATGVPARTTRRWLGWWRGPFVRTEVFIAIRARLIGVETALLPASILDRLPSAPEARVRTMLDLLAPITTDSVAEGARFLREMA
ncbi:MAG: hypothetical protein ACREK4_11370 [Candidatus Rokuibacteriota bacterium]